VLQAAEFAKSGALSGASDKSLLSLKPSTMRFASGALIFEMLQIS